MGRINKGPNGGFSGKAGSVIGSSWRDIFYIKGLQKKITKPRSQGQLEQQAKFALAVKFLHPVKDILNMGFGNVNPQGATGYNMGISHLLNYSIRGTYPDLEIDYPAVLFTRGKLALPQRVELKLEASNLKLSWNTELHQTNSFADDRVEILIYGPKSNIYYEVPGGLIRKQGETELVLPSSFTGDIVHVYVYLLTRDGKKWSDSLYVGMVQVG